jgi:ankyrin repeat protein
MATVSDVQIALTNEARRTELKTKLAGLQGAMDATASVVSRLSMLNNDTAIQFNAAQAELAALEVGAGPGITADFGPKSVITQFLETEREVAKAACVAYIKANPSCTESAAATAWDQAAAANNASTINMSVQSGLAMGRLYARNLAAQGLAPDSTWGSFRAWVIATPTDVIMAV